MVEAGRIYKFKEEFWPLINVSKNTWDRRKTDFLAWLENFYDYELIEGRPLRIFIKEVYGEYQPLPRKVQDLTPQKKDDYTRFAIASLGTEFKPNSKAKTAREAIAAFGYEKYGHTNAESVGKRYISPVFNEYGECDNKKKWVWYSTYEPLDIATLERWRMIMSEEHISEQEAANAFYRQEQGEDISKEKRYFSAARARFKAEFGDFVILTSSWRLKK